MKFNNTLTITFGTNAISDLSYFKKNNLVYNDIPGFDLNDLNKSLNIIENKGFRSEIINLNWYLPDGIIAPQANLLVIKNGIKLLTAYDADDLYTELNNLEYDTKTIKNGKICNKRSRYNLCLADYDQEPDIYQGISRFISFNSGIIPITKQIRDNLPDIFTNKAHNLVAEINNYYMGYESGIGYHTDQTRNRIIGIRLGNSKHLCFQWYYQRQLIGKKFVITLKHGDMYVMSHYAVGRPENGFVLKHAAGSNKFTKII